MVGNQFDNLFYMAITRIDPCFFNEIGHKSILVFKTFPMV
jgi:hypothetical protein